MDKICGDTKQDPVGFGAQKPFCILHFLIIGNRLILASKTPTELQ